MTTDVQLNTIYRGLGRIEGKIDSLHERFDRKDRLCITHRTKIENLETFQTQQKGAIWLLGILGGFIVVAAQWVVNIIRTGGNQ